MAQREAIRRAEIIAAASDVFFRDGFARTSMDDVLNEIGGSKRTLYKYFSSKEGLFSEIISSVSEEILLSLGVDVKGDLHQTLLDFGTRYMEMLVSPLGLAVYRAMISEALHVPLLAQIFYQNGTGRLNVSLTKFFETYNRTAEKKISNPTEASDSFLAILRGDMHLAALIKSDIPSRKEIKRKVECAVETLLDGSLSPNHTPPHDTKNKKSARLTASRNC